jgi:dipeptide/tripeptide permease
MSNAEADVQYSYWSGMCFITPLIGGYVADTYMGRYIAILVFSIIYLIGLVMIAFGSIPGAVNAAVIFPAM